MDTSQPPEENRNREPHAVFQKMGMALSILGTLIFAMGLVACRLNSDGKPSLRNMAMLLFAIALFVAGLSTWYNEKTTD
ncbi:MAG: hypothetical protein KAH99_05050 [Verrucomicrobia bacterium]|nr:hypothetical protein [Verrucomicrobiota bacterium]